MQLGEFGAYLWRRWVQRECVRRCGVGVFDSGGTVQSLHVECSLTMIPEVSGVKRVKPIMI